MASPSPGPLPALMASLCPSWPRPSPQPLPSLRLRRPTTRPSGRQQPKACPCPLLPVPGPSRTVTEGHRLRPSLAPATRWGLCFGLLQGSRLKIGPISTLRPPLGNCHKMLNCSNGYSAVARIPADDGLGIPPLENAQFLNDFFALCSPCHLSLIANGRSQCALSERSFLSDKE